MTATLPTQKWDGIIGKSALNKFVSSIAETLVAELKDDSKRLLNN